MTPVARGPFDGVLSDNDQAKQDASSAVTNMIRLSQ